MGYCETDKIRRELGICYTCHKRPVERFRDCAQCRSARARIERRRWKAARAADALACERKRIQRRLRRNSLAYVTVKQMLDGGCTMPALKLRALPDVLDPTSPNL